MHVCVCVCACVPHSHKIATVPTSSKIAYPVVLKNSSAIFPGPVISQLICTTPRDPINLSTVTSAVSPSVTTTEREKVASPTTPAALSFASMTTRVVPPSPEATTAPPVGAISAIRRSSSLSGVVSSRMDMAKDERVDPAGNDRTAPLPGRKNKCWLMSGLRVDKDYPKQL